MAQREGRTLTWKNRTPNGSEDIADFPSERTGETEQTAEVALHQQTPQTMMRTMASATYSQVTFLTIGDEDRTEIDSHVCAVFPSHTVLQGRCELPPIPSETHAIKP